MLLSGLCCALYLTALLLFAALHRLDRSVHWLHDPVSQYIRGPYATLFRWYGHIGTAAALLLTIELFHASAPIFAPKVVISMALLVVLRVGVVLIPTDPKHAPATAKGRLHLALAIATFAATYTAIASATPAFALDAATPLVLSLIAMRYLALASLSAVVLTMLPGLKAFFGLAERAFLASTQLWFLGCSLWFTVTRMG
ncbi:DUF998 domain-containing protein [Vandammella animalimorsus]|uniref:DUF998 domain-containing protein n=1 Tax=Vandammella animalimorsus TaxID=2029117 RepID=A0A2A2A5F3_9BURK|nr:DUF998 domain-containing protein [Vandammella animalimorsus]PAT33715.1 hypothetical protein CK620_11115 [Vandammella animalimorsus]